MPDDLLARAREHLEELLAFGNSLDEIAVHLSTSNKTLRSIIDGTTMRGTPAILERILAAPVESLGMHVLAEPISRRLQALAAAGHSQSVIAEAAGVNRDTVMRVQQGQWQRLRLEDAERLREAYAKLAQTPGGTRRTARHALSKGWPPPSAWTEADLGDPDVHVAERVRAQWQKQGDRSATIGDNLREVREANDYTRGELAAKLGVAETTLRAWENDRYLPQKRYHEALWEVLRWKVPE